MLCVRHSLLKGLLLLLAVATLAMWTSDTLHALDARHLSLTHVVAKSDACEKLNAPHEKRKECHQTVGGTSATRRLRPEEPEFELPNEIPLRITVAVIYAPLTDMAPSTRAGPNHGSARAPFWGLLTTSLRLRN